MGGRCWRWGQQRTVWPAALILLLIVGFQAGPHATSAPADEPVVLVGAGDIADCNEPNDEATAALLANIPGTVYTLGDNAYGAGSTKDYVECYDPSWGAVKDRTRPAPGNHEYNTEGAAPYFDYFGAAAGERGKGYYSYDLGRYWHAIALNSNCDEVGGCDEASPQYQWLEHDLQSHPRRHVIAYWHHPRYSSGTHGNNTDMDPFWDLLYQYGAEIVLSGHDHDYERYARMDDHGDRDDQRGIREFVVGTGGKSLREMHHQDEFSEVRDASSYGVLKLTLYADHYDWQFVPIAGDTLNDSGTTRCHASA